MVKKISKTAKVQKAEAGEPLPEQWHVTSIRVPLALYERLRRLAFDKRRSMLGLILESIEDRLRKEKY